MPHQTIALLNRLRRPGWPGAALLAFIIGLTALEPGRNLSYDLLFALRGDIPTPTNVVVVLARLESLPHDGVELTRIQHAEAIARIAEDHPKLVFYDFLFKAEAKGDTNLASAMHACPNFFLVSALEGT